MVSVLASSVVDRVFEPGRVKPKTINLSIHDVDLKKVVDPSLRYWYLVLLC